MDIKLKSISVIISLMFMVGCVAYAPPPYSVNYAAPMVAPYGMQPQIAPYGGYGYGVTPIVPVPVIGFGGWGFRGFRR
jgi:hypothetical protein